MKNFTKCKHKLRTKGKGNVYMEPKTKTWKLSNSRVCKEKYINLNN